MTQDIQTHGEALVSAARAGDDKTARRHTDFFVLNHYVDEGIPYWERAVAEGDAFSHFTLARYRKVRGDRPAAEALYRAVAERHIESAYGLGVLLKENGDPEAAEWFRHGWEWGGHLDCKIELGKLLAAEGRLDEAATFLMDDAGLGDIAVFRWVKLFESIGEQFAQVAELLDIAETAAAYGDAETAAERAAEVTGPLLDLEEHFRDYPALADKAAGHYRRAAALTEQARVAQASFLAITTDYEAWPEARALLVQAHEAGYEGASFGLGILHSERGEIAEAEHWYEVSYGHGNRRAAWKLGLLCKWQQRYEDAERWFRKAGENNADVVAQLDDIAALRAEDDTSVPGDPDPRGLTALRERAEAGDTGAAYAYGDALYERPGVDPRALVRWWEPAAAAGDPDAAYDLGDLYGKVGEPELRDAWYRKAAEAGHHYACQRMGWLSEQHYDFQEAERWYERAAGSGEPLHAMLAGKLKAQRGAYAEAEPLLRTAWEECAEESGGTEAAGYYGLVLHRLGRLAEAVEPLQAAAEDWDEDVRPRYSRDDLTVLSRMVKPRKELKAVNAALAE
ncbi:tetratricopeptide repeat protein [Streptomyces boluensis]|nr:sel1 repeat family protein [Streptomyces boluensis]